VPDGGGRGASAGRRTGPRWLWGLAAAAFLIGADAGSGGTLGAQVLRILALLGAPQYDAYREMYAPGNGLGQERSDYLFFFHRGGGAEASAYLAGDPLIRVSDQTIFSNGLVVSLPEPAGPIVAKLRAQPFTWMVLRDRPYFFCH